MVRYVLKVSLCALLLSPVGVLGACGDDDSSDDGTEDDGDDGTEADAGDDGGEPDAGDGADSGVDEVTQEGQFVLLPDMEPIKGSSGTLVRTPEGMEIELTVPGLIPGNLYTMWWVIFQNPDACLTTPDAEIQCSPADTAGGMVPDPKVYTATQGALVYGGPAPDGATIADKDGTVTFTRTYAVNTDPTEGIYVGPKEDPSYWEGLTDVLAAEVHVAIRDKGPPSEDKEILAQQQTLFFADNCVQAGAGGDYMCATSAALPFAVPAK